MKILRRVRQLFNAVLYRFRYWRIEYQLWAARPRFFGAIALLLFVGMLATAANWGMEGAELREDTGIQRSIATAFEKSPGVLLQHLEAKKESMSAYQYELQYEQYRFFARNAPSIAQRIRNDAFWNIFKKIGIMTGKEVAQNAAGKIVGKAADVVGTRIGYQAAKAGEELVQKGYRATGRFIGSRANTLIWSAGELGDKSTTLAIELTNAATRSDEWMTPTLQKAMARPEFAELFQLLKKATEQNPDRLMEAALYQYIKMAGNAKDRPDDEYRKSVMITAQHLIKLTREGGSSDSMWQDVDALARWVAEKIGRPLPDAQETPTETTKFGLPSTFTALGEFSGLEEKLHYAADHFTINSVRFTIKDGLVIGNGELHRQNEFNEDNNYFTFSGKFQDKSDTTTVKGSFYECKVVHKREEKDLQTKQTSSYSQTFTWSATLKDGKIIGTMTGWPNEFELGLD